jgi:hypothetical protein
MEAQVVALGSFIIIVDETCKFERLSSAGTLVEVATSPSRHHVSGYGKAMKIPLKVRFS